MTPAQMGPFLDGLSTGAHLRAVHPGDPVELWLDDEHLVPLEVTVRAASDPDGRGGRAARGPPIVPATPSCASRSRP